MMSCRCNTSTLSLFIRSLAQIEISATSTLSVSGKLQRASFPTITNTRAFRRQQIPGRFYSTAVDKPFAPDRAAESWSVTQNDVPNEAAPDASAVVEFSMDAIDALAKESSQSKNWYAHQDDEYELPPHAKQDDGYDTPLKLLLKDAPQKKERAARKAFQDFRPTDIELERNLSAHTNTGRFGKEVIRPANANWAAHPDTKTLKIGREEQSRDDWIPPPREKWMIDKERLKEKFPDGWQPLKRLSPDAIAGIRALHAQMPGKYTTQALSQEFKVTPEAIRRILKSKWTPNSEEESDRQRRWFKRGEKVWSRYAELGMKPPKPWREQGIGNGRPEWMLKKRAAAAAALKYVPPPLPALITTKRKMDDSDNQVNTDNFGDRIL